MHHRFTKTGSGRTHRESSSSSTQQARSMRCAFSFARETVSYASLGRKQPVSVWSQEVEVNSWDQERGIRTTEMRHEVYIYIYIYIAIYICSMQHAGYICLKRKTSGAAACCFCLLMMQQLRSSDLTCLVLSCLVWSGLFLSCLVLPCLVSSCHLVLSCLISSRLVSCRLPSGQVGFEFRNDEGVLLRFRVADPAAPRGGGGGL